MTSTPSAPRGVDARAVQEALTLDLDAASSGAPADGPAGVQLTLPVSVAVATAPRHSADLILRFGRARTAGPATSGVDVVA